MRSAARIIGARAWSCRRQSTFCPRMPGLRSPLSLMLARSGITPARQPSRPPAKSFPEVPAQLGAQASPMRYRAPSTTPCMSAPRSAWVSFGNRRSVRCGSIIRSRSPRSPTTGCSSSASAEARSSEPACGRRDWQGMTEPFFFNRGSGLSVREIAALTGAKLQSGAHLDRRITGIAALDHAAPSDLAFLDKAKYAPQLSTSAAGACLTTQRYAGHAGTHTSVLCIAEPYRAFVEVVQALFPDALRPSSLFEAEGVAVGAFVHPSARMEHGVTVDP